MYEQGVSKKQVIYRNDFTKHPALIEDVNVMRKSLKETQWRTKFLNVGEKIYRLEMLCNISRILFITKLVFFRLFFWWFETVWMNISQRELLFYCDEANVM